MGRTDEEVKVILEDLNESARGMEEAESGVSHLRFYRNCYSEALNVIMDNLSAQEARHSGQRRETSRFGEVPEDVSSAKNSNIIAFIGKRGSGKTTAINEFSDILRSYQNRSEKWNDMFSCKTQRRQECRFHVMTPIDASVLDKKEDLIELIWADMYREFERYSKSKNHSFMDDELDKRIMREFDEVYKNYVNVGHEERREVLGETVLVKLKNISSSLRTREAFMALVTDFLRLLDGEDYRGDSALVIAVDDLDMNIEKGYEMLEQLHKYLANRRIVILTAVDYDQMRLVCERDFLDVLTPGRGKWSNGNEMEERARRLSNDYLLKVIPLPNRIYIPGRDVISKRSLVKYRNKMESGKDITESMKGFLLAKIALKTGIFYDARGSKKHFCLPDTVREFMTYNSFLDSLISMEEIENAEQESKVPLYDKNHERFNRDITDRMAPQILDQDQINIFELILGRSIERRAAYAVNFIRNRLDDWERHDYGLGDKKDLHKKDLHKEDLRDEDGKDFQDRVDEQNDYCYGDLLGVIYVLGRKRYSDKPLVHCLLASFTSEMVREYYSYRNNTNEEARGRAAERLKNFLGVSFGGAWLGGSMPEAVRRSWSDSMIRSGTSAFQIGYIKDGQISNVRIKGFFDGEQSGGLEEIECLVSELTGLVPYLECLTLLFSNFRDAARRNIDPQWEFELEQEGREDREIRYTIRSNAASADFDVFGFIGREMAEEEIKNSLEQSLSENIASCIIKHLGKMGRRITTGEKKIREKVEKSVKNNSIWKGRQGKTAVFPYYSLDMSYNIMKRVRRKIKETGKISSDDIYDFFARVYGFVAEGIREEEKFYKDETYYKERKGQYKVNLYDNFVECPFISAFGIQCEERKYSRQARLSEVFFNTMLNQVLSNIVIDSHLMLDEQNMELE